MVIDLDAEWRHTDGSHRRKAACQIFEIFLLGSNLVEQWFELQAERLK